MTKGKFQTILLTTAEETTMKPWMFVTRELLVDMSMRKLEMTVQVTERTKKFTDFVCWTVKTKPLPSHIFITRHTRVRRTNIFWSPCRSHDSIDDLKLFRHTSFNKQQFTKRRPLHTIEISSFPGKQNEEHTHLFMHQRLIFILWKNKIKHVQDYRRETITSFIFRYNW